LLLFFKNVCTFIFDTELWNALRPQKMCHVY
jgi:hypothetical protein